MAPREGSGGIGPDSVSEYEFSDESASARTRRRLSDGNMSAPARIAPAATANDIPNCPPVKGKPDPPDPTAGASAYPKSTPATD